MGPTTSGEYPKVSQDRVVTTLLSTSTFASQLNDAVGLLLRRHVPDAQSDRRQSYHGLQCLCGTRLLSVQIERKPITKGCAVKFQDRKQAYDLAGNSIPT